MFINLRKKSTNQQYFDVIFIQTEIIYCLLYNVRFCISIKFWIWNVSHSNSFFYEIKNIYKKTVLLNNSIEIMLLTKYIIIFFWFLFDYRIGSWHATASLLYDLWNWQCNARQKWPWSKTIYTTHKGEIKCNKPKNCMKIACNFAINSSESYHGFSFSLLQIYVCHTPMFCVIIKEMRWFYFTSYYACCLLPPSCSFSNLFGIASKPTTKISTKATM